MWPTVVRALDYVVGMQSPGGEIPYARKPDGSLYNDVLLTGCSSTLQSLRCGLALADLVGEQQPDWELAAGALHHVLVAHPEVFTPKDRWSMDWYYPVLGGALRGDRGLERIREGWDTFVVPSLGARCVSDQPWVTGAETCELAIALHTLGDDETARRLVRDIQHTRHDDGGYWTGWQFANQVMWPTERSSWTSAAVHAGRRCSWRTGPPASSSVQLIFLGDWTRSASAGRVRAGRYSPCADRAETVGCVDTAVMLSTRPTEESGVSNPMTESLKRLTIFAACSTKDLEAVARLSTTLDYPAGKVLATEGVPGQEFVVIRAGTVTVTPRRHRAGRARPRRLLRRDLADGRRPAHRDRHRRRPR